MYINQVKLRNFRNFKSLDLEFYPGKNVIAGKNNVGKSNIIRAIGYVLGEKPPTSFETTDFHATRSLNSDEPQYASSFTIYVQLKKYADHPDYKEDILLNYKSKTGYKCISKPIFNEDTQEIDDDYLSLEEKSQPKWKAEELSSRIEEADSVSVFLHVQDEKDTGEIIKYYRIILTTEEGNFLIYNVKNLRDCLITSAIIQAIRSPDTDLRINNYSWYSKMLKKHWESTSQDSRRKELNKLNQQLQEGAGDILNKITSEITSKISDNVSRATNVESVKFKIEADNIDELYKAARIFISDANFEAGLENMGTGTQSYIIISLFSIYCQTINRSGTLLAIEEPECYLHPHARRALSSFLDSFVQIDAEDTKPKNQIILTTHSIEFLKDVPLENIHILRKDASGASKVFSIPKNDAKGYKQKIGMIINSNAEIFFADCVILVEGGEKHLLPLIADLERKDGQTANPLDQNNISVVGVGGKSKFGEYLSLLMGLEIPYYVIADLDMLEGPELQQMKGHPWKIDGTDRNKILQQLAEIIKKPDSEAIKEVKKELYEVLENAYESGKITDDLKKRLCKCIKSRHQKREGLEECEIELKNKTISALEVRNKLFDVEHICILQKGELEDYYLSKAQEIKQSAKEVTARRIADEVWAERYTTQRNTIEEYLDVSDYREVIRRAIRECPGSKDK